MAGWRERAGSARCSALVLSALALAAVACTDTTAAQPHQNPTIPTLPPPAPTTTTTDPYAVPEVIDEAYVNRVLKGLDSAVGDIVRIVVGGRTIRPEVVARLESMYSEPSVIDRILRGFSLDVADGFEGYQDPPGNQSTVVSELISNSSSCIFAEIRRSYSDVGIDSAAEDRQWIALVPATTTQLLSMYNPTPWAYVYEGFQRGQLAPPDPCVSQ